MRTVLLLLMGILINTIVFAQNRVSRVDIKKGNKLYQEKKYDAAQKSYEQGLKKDPESFKGNFNLGDALYQKGDYENARKAFNAGIQSTNDKVLQARAYHNIGNTFLKEKKWEEAVNAYKNSLKLNAKDPSAKYNLAYAQAMMKKQKQKNKDNKKNKKENKDQNKKNQQNKDQNKKDQNKKDQDKKNQQNKDQQNKDQKDKGQSSKDQQNKDQQKKEGQQHPQPMPSKLSKQEAENLLNALNQEERQLHQKEKKETGVPVQLDKDW